MWNLPNFITIFRTVLIPPVVWLTWPGIENRTTCFWAGLLYSLAGILDIVDGAVARRTGEVTKIGKFLDPLVDKLFQIIVLLVLLTLPGPRVPLWLVLVIVTREICITALRGMAAAEGLVIEAGQEGKLKTAIATLGTSGLIFHYSYLIDFGWMRATINFEQLGLLLMYLSVYFSLHSAFSYTRQFLRAISHRDLS